MGGVIDITSGISDVDGFAGAVKPSRCAAECIAGNVPLSQVTMSSDANGSMAVYDDKGGLVKLLVTKADSMLSEFQDMAKVEHIPIETALRFVTSNVAEAIGLYPKKGTTRENSDADLALLTDGLKVDTVIAKGKIVLRDGIPLISGTFSSD